jgi:hypothetical protein
MDRYGNPSLDNASNIRILGKGSLKAVRIEILHVVAHPMATRFRHSARQRSARHRLELAPDQAYSGEDRELLSDLIVSHDVSALSFTF